MGLRVRRGHRGGPRRPARRRRRRVRRDDRAIRRRTPGHAGRGADLRLQGRRRRARRRSSTRAARRAEPQHRDRRPPPAGGAPVGRLRPQPGGAGPGQGRRAHHQVAADRRHGRDDRRGRARRWPTSPAVGVDIVTIGQYLRPTSHHLPVARWWTPDEFDALEARSARRWASRHVEAGPLTRSSYHARQADAAAAGRRRRPTAAIAADRHGLSRSAHCGRWAGPRPALDDTCASGSPRSTCSSSATAPTRRRRPREPLARRATTRFRVLDDRDRSPTSTSPAAASRRSPHLRENGRLTVMFCAFEGRRRGSCGCTAGATVRAPGDDAFDAAGRPVPRPARRPVGRSVLDVDRRPVVVRLRGAAHGLRRASAPTPAPSGPSAQGPDGLDEYRARTTPIEHRRPARRSTVDDPAQPRRGSTRSVDRLRRDGSTGCATGHGGAGRRRRCCCRSGADLPWLSGYEAMPLERLTMLVVPARRRRHAGRAPARGAAGRAERRDLFTVRPWGETEDPIDIVAALVGRRRRRRHRRSHVGPVPRRPLRPRCPARPSAGPARSRVRCGR